MPTHEQETLYNDIARNISAQVYTHYSQVREALRRVYPDDLSFKGAFTEKELRTTNSRNKKVVRYLLFEIERQCSGQEFDFESAMYNLEHILPENPSEDWNYIDEAKQIRLIYRLGNITPLETKPNRALGNTNYATKKAVFQESTFQIGFVDFGIIMLGEGGHTPFTFVLFSNGAALKGCYVTIRHLRGLPKGLFA